MKKNTVLAAMIIFSPIAFGEEPNIKVSGSLGVTSDYIFRGISQTGGDMAMQGQVEVLLEDQLFLRAFGSNVDFHLNDETSLELDGSIGYTNSIQDFQYEAGFTTYYYPGSQGPVDYSFNEVFIGGNYTYENATVGGSINYSPEYFGETGKTLYFEGHIDIALPNGFGVGGAIGRLNYDDSQYEDITDYRITLSKEFGETFVVAGSWFDNSATKNLQNADFVDQTWAVDAKITF